MGRFALALIAGTLAAGVPLTGAAQASSILTLEASDRPVGPSMIVIGAPAEPAMAKDEKVAAIDKIDKKGDARGAAHFPPMVIRGGIVGDAFARMVAPASAPRSSQAVSADPSGPTPR